MVFCRAYSLTWPASMQIYGNKRNFLHKKRVQHPQDLFGTTWNTNMAAMTSCEYALCVKMPNFTKMSTSEDELFSSPSLPTFDKIQYCSKVSYQSRLVSCATRIASRTTRFSSCAMRIA